MSLEKIRKTHPEGTKYPEEYIHQGRQESVPGHAMSATERYKNPTSGKEEGCLKRHNYSVQAILWPKKNTFPPALQDFIYFASTYIYTTLPLANNSE